MLNKSENYIILIDQLLLNFFSIQISLFDQVTFCKSDYRNQKYIHTVYKYPKTKLKINKLFITIVHSIIYKYLNRTNKIENGEESAPSQCLGMTETKNIPHK